MKILPSQNDIDQISKANSIKPDWPEKVLEQMSLFPYNFSSEGDDSSEVVSNINISWDCNWAIQDS